MNDLNRVLSGCKAKYVTNESRATIESQQLGIPEIHSWSVS